MKMTIPHFVELLLDSAYISAYNKFLNATEFAIEWFKGNSVVHSSGPFSESPLTATTNKAEEVAMWMGRFTWGFKEFPGVPIPKVVYRGTPRAGLDLSPGVIRYQHHHRPISSWSLDRRWAWHRDESDDDIVLQTAEPLRGKVIWTPDSLKVVEALEDHLIAVDADTELVELVSRARRVIAGFKMEKEVVLYHPKGIDTRRID